MDTFKVGDLAQVTFKVYATNTTTLVAPSSITATSVSPTGTTASVSLTNTGTGTYTGTVNLSAAGMWYVRCATTGTYQAAEEVEILVAPFEGP